MIVYYISLWQQNTFTNSEEKQNRFGHWLRELEGGSTMTWYK